MNNTNELREKGPKTNPGPKMKPPEVKNKGLEQAISEAGSIEELARRLEMSPGTIRAARKKGMTPGLALSLWERSRIKISKLLGRPIKCPHCFCDL